MATRSWLPFPAHLKRHGTDAFPVLEDVTFAVLTETSY
ncbi:MAG: hypothetical protein KatS3mg055_0741 [Chloroflexus sp.]|nr:MAG: hypothetical protein KatS3mg055_0741 [Chloroflexus sp.]